MIGKRTGAMLLVGTILSGWAAPLAAQETVPAPPTTAPPAPAPAPSLPTPAPAASGMIRSIAVRGAERLEPETVRSYANLNPGQSYTAETLDAALTTTP
jgi:outer membrane protein insertion porin family